MSGLKDFSTRYPLAGVPVGATAHGVTAIPASIDGRNALLVELSEDTVRNGTPDVDYHDAPTFLRIPCAFRSGKIEVAVRADLNESAPDYARAFAGIAYRIQPGQERFEALYVRPLNGRELGVPEPRASRAAQYFAFPDWKFDRLRDVYPEGPYEGGADIRPDIWLHLTLDISESSAIFSINGRHVLHIDETLAEPATGDIGLWVDIGTKAYFADLVITPKANEIG